MSKLKPDTVLKRMPGVTIHLDSITDIKISFGGNTDTYHEHTLAILDVFSRPTSIKDALAKLQSRGVQDWIDLTATITELYKNGILANQEQTQFTPDKKSNSFGAAPVHISLLNDKERTDCFFKLIAETVKQGDTVVDIGTGTGVLAIAAARAGAAHVYAIEAGEMADVAQAVFETTEVADKITLIRGWSTQIELPQKADVIVSEIIGNDPFAEKVLQTIKDAKQRFLKPDARFVPPQVTAYGIPVTLPPNVLFNNEIRVETLENWRRWYDVDFTPLQKINDASPPLLHMNTQKAASLQFLGEPFKIAEIDFQTFEETSIQLTTKATANQDGLLNGVLMYFDLKLGAETLTTHPLRTSQNNSWLNPVWYFDNARSVRQNEVFTVEYSYNINGKKNGVMLLETGIESDSNYQSSIINHQLK